MVRITILCFLAVIAAPFAFAQTTESFPGVLVNSCDDGDTCKVTIPNISPVFGENIPIRIKSIDAPQLRGKCQAEKDRAILARNHLRELVVGSTVDLLRVERDGFFRLLAEIRVKGEDVGGLMLKSGYAVRWDGKGKKKDWCQQDTGWGMLLVGILGGVLAFGLAGGGMMAIYRRREQIRRESLMQSIVARVVQIDGLTKTEAPVHVPEGMLEDQHLPSLNQLFLDISVQVMAAKDRGESALHVDVNTPSLAEAAAEIFNQTDVRAQVRENGSIKLVLEWG